MTFRQIAAVALLGGVLAVPATAFYALAYQPSRDLRDRLDERRTAVAQLEDRASRLKRRLAQLEAGDRAEIDVWPAGEANRAALNVQTAVQKLAQEARFPVRALRPMPTRTFAERDSIVIMAQARTSFDGLIRFLHAVGTSRPILLVDKLQARVIAQGQNANDLPTVDVRLEILAPINSPDGVAK